ncbi:MAG TPA: thermonuclease family protein [Chloroflexota bacterium]|nr:thermonuclease family protein [Chloroflexota bacterium]
MGSALPGHRCGYKLVVLGLLVSGALVGGGCGLLTGGGAPGAQAWPTAAQPRRTPIPLPEPTAPPPTATASPTRGPADFIGRQRTRVLRVWDGQHVLIENGLTVRYLGIQAPGAGVLGRPLEPLGRDAALYNVALVEGKEVELEQDVTDVDADGRLPRYVYVDGRFVNRELVAAGLARAAPREPDVRYRELLAEAEREAREAHRGLWASATTPTRAPTAPPRPLPTATPTASALPPPTATPAPGARPTTPPATAGPSPVRLPQPRTPPPTSAPPAPRFGEEPLRG